MKNEPLWRKCLICADMVCLVGALIFLTAAIFKSHPEGGLNTNLRFVSLLLMGVHFVLHGILNWKEQRWLAIFELGCVMFALILSLIVLL